MPEVDMDVPGFATMRFNRTPLLGREQLWHHDQTERNILAGAVKYTPGLYCASMDDAVMYGGELTRHVLSSCPLKNDRKYITVDTKVHMLMPGMSPAIPGWHTDGAPRGVRGGATQFNPIGGDPNVWLQAHQDARDPRYHLMVISSTTWPVCPTLFLMGEIDLTIPTEPDKKLYAIISAEIQRRIMCKLIKDEDLHNTRDGAWYSWDWWQIHTGQYAKTEGWRWLIRVTESDYLPPKTNLRDVIRTHQQAYAKPEFGW